MVLLLNDCAIGRFLGIRYGLYMGILLDMRIGAWVGLCLAKGTNVPLGISMLILGLGLNIVLVGIKILLWISASICTETMGVATLAWKHEFDGSFPQFSWLNIQGRTYHKLIHMEWHSSYHMFFHGVIY